MFDDPLAREYSDGKVEAALCQLSAKSLLHPDFQIEYSPSCNTIGSLPIVAYEHQSQCVLCARSATMFLHVPMSFYLLKCEDEYCCFAFLL